MDFLPMLSRFAYLSQNKLRHPIEVKTNQPLAAYSAMRTAGIAEAVAFPADVKDLSFLVTFLSENGIDFILLGKGTNTLFASDRYKGLIVSTERINSIRLEGVKITAGAGVSLARLCRFAAEAGLSGLECFYGIPGSVGGAVAMNAGAFGASFSDLSPISRILTEEGEEKTILPEEHAFSYRNSRFLCEPQPILLETEFLLTPSCRLDVYGAMDRYMAMRREKQPLEYPSLGSVFKRCEEGYPAKLLEDAGLKGFSLGGASVSEKHAGFIVNKGGASGADVLSLVEYIETLIYQKYKIRLVPEIRIVR